MRGILFILSGPSGTGKSTVLERVMKAHEHLRFSVSATTRKPRPGEVEGVHYFFINHKKFEDMTGKDEFLEWAHVHDEMYGTPRKHVSESLDAGFDVVLDIDVQGAMQLLDRREEGVYVFIAPPHVDELKKRLINRGTESEEKIARRLEVACRELTFAGRYQYIVVNDDLERACRDLEAIILAEHCRTSRSLNFMR